MSRGGPAARQTGPVSGFVRFRLDLALRSHAHDRAGFVAVFSVTSEAELLDEWINFTV